MFRHTNLDRVPRSGALALEFAALAGTLQRDEELKNEPQATPTHFSPFLRLKTTNKREESGKGRFKWLRGFKLGFEPCDPTSTLWLSTDTALALSLLSIGHLQVAIDRPQLGDY
uniref:Uncharacterized protein n=1 Tax=Solanum tuberosum TaxID=4113 RepID=M1DK03_SOLTU